MEEVYLPEGANLYPLPPALLERIDLRKLAKYFGPGAIIASVTIGSGELVWSSRSGAVFGYAMLWCFLYAGIIKGIQVYTGFRHLVLTGEHPLSAWRSMPGPRLWFPFLLVAPALPIMLISFSAISEMMGLFIHHLSGPGLEGAGWAAFAPGEASSNAWASAVLIACYALAIRSSDLILERVSLAVLGGLIFCVAVSVISSSPSIADIVLGLFVPSVPDYQPWIAADPQYSTTIAARSVWLEIALYLWAVGGGTQDYIGYLSMARDRAWGLAGRHAAGAEHLRAALGGVGEQSKRELQRARAWLVAPLMDTALSFSAVILVCVLFAVLGAQLLHPRHAIPDGANLLDLQEQFLTFLHPSLRWLYRLSVLLALGGTLYGAYRVYSLTLLETLAVFLPGRITTENRRRWEVASYNWLLLGSLLLIWLPAKVSGDIVARLSFATVIGGATSSGFWCLGILWLDRARLPGPLRMKPFTRALVWTAGLVMLLLGAQSIIAYFA